MNIDSLVPWPLNSELTSYWALLASITTAVGTFMLAFFAWKAWDAARETLEGQQNAVELAALSEYVRSLNAMSRMHKTAPAAYFAVDDGIITSGARYVLAYSAYVRDLCHEVEVTGAMWRVHHPEQDTYQSVLYLAEKGLIDAQVRRITADEQDFDEDDFEDTEFEVNRKFADDMVFWVKHYQTRPDDRQSLLNYISKRTHKLAGAENL